MSIAPFAPGSFNMRQTAQMFVEMRKSAEGLERQMATGRRSDTFAGLGAERRASLDLRAKLADIATYRTTIDDTTLRLKVTVKSLEALDEMASKTISGARQPQSDVLVGGRPQTQAFADSDLVFAIDLLNTEVGGRYVFGGLASDRPPVLPPEQLRAALDAHLGATDRSDPAALLAAVTDFFDSTDDWRAPGADVSPDPDGNGRTSASARVDDGVVVGVGARADETAFRRLLTGLAALSFAADGMTREDFATLGRDAADLIQGAQPSLRGITAELGMAYANVGTVGERQKDRAAMLEGTLADIEGVRTEEVAVSLLTLQTRLQASYQTTSTLSRLSLVNFL